MYPRPPGVKQPSTWMPVAPKAMDLAAELVRARLPSVVSAKGDRDMVSDVYVEIERAVRDYLRTQIPQVGFLGEEEGNAPGQGELWWVFDPIDEQRTSLRGFRCTRSRWC